MSQEFEKRLGEWASWYHEHKRNVRNSEDFEAVKDFLIRAVDGSMELPSREIMLPAGVIAKRLPGE